MANTGLSEKTRAHSDPGPAFQLDQQLRKFASRGDLPHLMNLLTKDQNGSPCHAVSLCHALVPHLPSTDDSPFPAPAGSAPSHVRPCSCGRSATQLCCRIALCRHVACKMRCRFASPRRFWGVSEACCCVLSQRLVGIPSTSTSATRITGIRPTTGPATVGTPRSSKSSCVLLLPLSVSSTSPPPLCLHLTGAKCQVGQVRCQDPGISSVW